MGNISFLRPIMGHFTFLRPIMSHFTTAGSPITAW